MDFFKQFDSFPLPMMGIGEDGNGRIIYANPCMLRLFHCAEADRLLMENDCFERCLRRIDGENACVFERISVCPRGMQMLDLNVNAYKLEINGSRIIIICLHLLSDDTQTQKTMEERARYTESTLNVVLDNLAEPIFVTDLQTLEILYANRALEKLLETGDVVGQKCTQTIQEAFVTNSEECPTKLLYKSLSRGLHYFNDVMHLRSKRWFHMNARMIDWIDGRTVCLQSASEITARKNVEDKLREQAFSDALTGLKNYCAGKAFLSQAIGEVKSTKISTVVCFIDVDKLKTLNDTYGHVYGNKVLIRLGELITASVRETDVVSRIGGDEFLIILRRCTISGAKQVIRKLRAKLAACGNTEQFPATPDISCGLFEMTPELDLDSDEILGLADQLMYAEKRSKKMNCHSMALSQKDQRLPV